MHEDLNFQLLETTNSLLAELAKHLARELAPLLPQVPPAEPPAARRLLTLEQLLPLLPAGKGPETWKGWLYQRTRLGQVPGCHKIGGRLFFDSPITLAWLANRATSRPNGGRLDVSGTQSKHAPAVPAQDHTTAPNPEIRAG